MFDNLKDILWAMNPKNRIWPPNHNDPRVKGPQPRILSYEAALELRRRQRETQGDETGSVVHRDDSVWSLPIFSGRKLTSPR